MRILFTGGGGIASQKWRELLGDSAFFADAQPLPDTYQVPLAGGPHFIGQLSALCKELVIDLLVPGVDEELLYLAMARDSFLCPIYLPDDASVATYPDKLHIMRELQNLGIQAPITERLRFMSKVTYPCVVKPRFGRGSRDVRIVVHEREMIDHLHETQRGPSDFIVQEYLVGQEYTVTCVSDQQKRLQAVIPIRVDLKQRSTIKGAVDMDADVIAACEAIHNAKPFSGPMNMQVMKTERSVVPFEFNPRISTTTVVAYEAGCDVFGLFLGTALPQPIRELVFDRSAA